MGSTVLRYRTILYLYLVLFSTRAVPVQYEYITVGPNTDRKPVLFRFWTEPLITVFYGIVQTLQVAQFLEVRSRYRCL
jgi:hypothetical protein